LNARDLTDWLSSRSYKVWKIITILKEEEANHRLNLRLK